MPCSSKQPVGVGSNASRVSTNREDRSRSSRGSSPSGSEYPTEVTCVPGLNPLRVDDRTAGIGAERDDFATSDRLGRRVDGDRALIGRGQLFRILVAKRHDPDLLEIANVRHQLKVRPALYLAPKIVST